MGLPDKSAEKYQLLQRALDALPLSLNIKTADGHYGFINAHQARNAGMPAEDIIGQEVGVAAGETWRRIIRERDIKVLETREPMGPYRDDFAALFGLDGHWITFKAPFSLHEGDAPDHVVTISFDVTPFVEAENRLISAANTDALTGLPNRRWFDRQIEHMANRAEHPSAFDWLLVIDVDHFKSINDTYGHQVGDGVLRETGTRLRQSIRSCDSAVRLGGEEFVVLVSDASSEEVGEIAERIRLAFDGKPMTRVESSPSITVSIGAADIESRDAHAALRRADDALYLAKKIGRNRVVLADQAQQP
jgi:diguanylate cyclase (GGDEF)-like protein